jgi:hypothetical protein
MVENPLEEWVDLLLMGRFLIKLIFWEKSLCLLHMDSARRNSDFPYSLGLSGLLQVT